MNAKMSTRESTDSQPSRENPGSQPDRKLLNPLLEEKYYALCNYLRELKSVAVAFSGGVDSTLLLKVAHDTLGDKTIALTANCPAFPLREITLTRTFCESENIRHIIFDSHICESEAFFANPLNRCYFCKRALLSEITEIAHEQGAIFVAEGSNLDDENDYRPGLVAVDESDVISPLREMLFSKEDIRCLARSLGLPMWNKPSFACLATRIPYGERITEEKLARIDAAEQLLIDLGFDQVRVRCHDNLGENLARIEVMPNDIVRFTQACTSHNIPQKLKELGFAYVTVDQEGYTTGKMNESKGQ